MLTIGRRQNQKIYMVMRKKKQFLLQSKGIKKLCPTRYFCLQTILYKKKKKEEIEKWLVIRKGKTTPQEAGFPWENLY